MSSLLSPLTPPLKCIFLADRGSVFRKSMVFSILTRVGDNASIPCLATDPTLDDLRLETCSGKALTSGLQYSTSLEQGILIHNTQKAFEGCYVCTGRLGEKHVRSNDYSLTVRPGKTVGWCLWTCRDKQPDANSIMWLFLSVPIAPPEIEVQASKRVILTCNESFSLTCNTSNVNGEIQLRWVTPPGSVRPFSSFFVFSHPVGQIFKKILVCGLCFT